jgi:hypothetical protein
MCVHTLCQHASMKCAVSTCNHCIDVYCMHMLYLYMCVLQVRSAETLSCYGKGKGDGKNEKYWKEVYTLQYIYY